MVPAASQPQRFAWRGNMKSKPSNEYLPWLIAGLVFMALLLVVGWHFREGMNSPAQALASKASRVDLVGRMQLDLASASEAEKSAVLAISDQDSQAFADQARATSARVENERRELAELLTADGTQGERESSAQFATAFAEFQRVDD